MGLKNSKNSEKRKTARKTAPSYIHELTSDSSSDDATSSRKRDYVQVADKLHQHVKDEDLARSLSYSNRSSDKSLEAENENVASLAALSLQDADELKDGAGGIAPQDSLISDDESDSGGEEKLKNPSLCGLSSLVNVQLSNSSISPNLAIVQPSEPILTDDESQVDDRLLVNDRSLLEVLPEKPHELSISTRLIRGSMSELSSEEASESGDESCEDVPDDSRDAPLVPLRTLDTSSSSTESESDDQDVKDKVQSAATTIKSRGPTPLTQPVKAFYIPRENLIPQTEDATLKSTAFERIRLIHKSKIFSNVLTDDSIWRVKSVEKVWRSINNLSDTTHWQKLLTFGEPVLMNFKLIELKSSFENILKNTSEFASCSPIFEVLGEITRSKFESHKAEVFKELATPHFIRNLYSIVEKCHNTRPREPLLNRFIENFVDIYGDIFLQLDSLASDGLANDLEGLIRSCLSLVESGNDQSSADQLQHLSMIIESRDTLIRANSSFPFNVLKEESVESNIIDGPYDSVDQYLTVHYRLMKEDFQNSLRVGVIDHMKTVHGLKRKSVNYHLNVFKNVTLASHLTGFAVKYKIIFYDPVVLNRIRDPASPNFLTGSLLMLTNNHFQDYSLVRVEDRSPLEREQSHIFVSMVLGPPGFLRMIHFNVMAEPSRLFEPYYRVLNVLRSIDGHHFPFLRYIVDVETDVFPPAFMKPNTELKIDSYTCNLWENDTWPAPESIGLNPVQLEGLKQGLRNELAIIQGPPGTGKTYLSKKIIEILLQNKSLWHKNGDDGAGLIMVVCFKNQSLDQLLTGLIKDKVKVLRIGTQSKEEMLDAYNLKTLDDPKFSQIYKKMRWLLAKEQKRVINDLKDSLEIVDEITAHSGIIKLEYFSYLLRLSEGNLSYLKANYEKWLLDIPCSEPDFRAVENVLGEQTWTGNLDYLEEQSEVYQTTLQDVVYLLERVNAKLDVLIELGNSDFVDLLTSAAVFLVQKQKFMEYRFYELKSAVTADERLRLYEFKKEFEGEDQHPLEELPVDQRWRLYKAWMHDLYQHHSKLIESFVAKSAANSQRYIEIEELLNMRKISQCDAEVVGLTTTAAAKYFKVMDCLKPKIVLVEEAAEVMEAHTVASLSKYCEHLILLGDHKQLRPLTSSHIVGREAHLDYSLYERLVRNSFQPCTLNTQYRMRPDIADLIRPAVYKELLDDPSVSQYPQVLGVTANVYFVDHTVKEDVTADIVSRWNRHEAEFHLALCNYLVLQGYQPSQITILATYSEQERYFNREKLNYPHLEEVLMATVDSFQGKENDIVLLSLVRSNAEAVIGFLAQENRINVALSRAKIGLFITGNKSNLLARDGLWTRVVGVLQKKKAIGRKLPLKCQIHGKITLVAHSREIKALRNGGCAKQCKAALPCGHKCLHLCHPLDRQHEDMYKCLTPCNKVMDCAHRCTLTCHSTNPLVFKCFCRSCSPRSRCDAPLPCGHTCQLLGHVEDIEHKSTHQCQVICNTVAPCGHVCASLCHIEDKEHQAAYRCVIKCEGVLVCGHPCGVESTNNKQHDCRKHELCLLCRNPFSMSNPQPGDIQIESASLGNAVTERSSVSGNTIRYHKCVKRKYTKVCVLKCRALLSCHHLCCKPCHSSKPHTVQDKCATCSKTDEIQEKLRKLQIDHQNGQPFEAHCEHNVNIEQCNEACNEMLCGHDCSDRRHTCSSHYGIQCREKCPAVLSCRHKCVRLCHLGDDNHFCSKPKCLNSGSGPTELAVTLDVEPGGSSELGAREKVENLSPTNETLAAKMVKTYLTPGHKCRTKGRCTEMCKTVLNCGHECPLKCQLHKESPSHVVTEKCSFCSRSDHMWEEFTLLNMDHPKGSPFLHCSHHVKNYECDKFCPGRLCGHPCEVDRLNHLCSDHISSGRVECPARCLVRLSCGHKCTRLCHLGDVVHQCKCLSNVDPGCATPETCKAFKSCAIAGCGSPKLAGRLITEMEGSLGFGSLDGVDNPNPGTGTQPARIVNKCIRPGHKCHLVNGICRRVCKTELHCGHECRLTCRKHEGFKGPNHVVGEKCSFCSRSDHMWGKFSLLGIDHPKESPFSHCTHLVKSFKCEKICPGRPCGQPCEVDRPNHLCSDHITSGRVECPARCAVHLSCGHRCARSCHLGDYVHQCTKKKCPSSVESDLAVSESVSGVEDLELISSIPKPAEGKKDCVSDRLETDSPASSDLFFVRAGISVVLKCRALLSCQHLCCKPLHSSTPHKVQDKCATCSLTDEVEEKLRRLQIDHTKGRPFSLHCEHNVNVEQCDQTCSGMLCGHDHFGRKHTCSSHYGIQCQEKCLAVLSCRHKCARLCHLGDDHHFCHTPDCLNAVSESFKLAAASDT